MYLFIFDKCVLFKYGELEMKTQSIFWGDLTDIYQSFCPITAMIHLRVPYFLINKRHMPNKCVFQEAPL